MQITVETTVHAPLDAVWQSWTRSEEIMLWNFANDDWCCPRAEHDLSVGGSFNYRMETRDGSMGFDYIGTFTEIEDQAFIGTKIGDGRKVTARFEADPEGNGVKVVGTFEAECENAAEMQRKGWQAILDNFKRHVESTTRSERFLQG